MTNEELSAACLEASKVAISPVLGSLFAQAGAALTTAEAALAAERARVVALEEALAPFAAGAERYAPNSIVNINDNRELWQLGNFRVDFITVGDLRRAARARTTGESNG